MMNCECCNMNEGHSEWKRRRVARLICLELEHREAVERNLDLLLLAEAERGQVVHDFVDVEAALESDVIARKARQLRRLTTTQPQRDVTRNFTTNFMNPN